MPARARQILWASSYAARRKTANRLTTFARVKRFFQVQLLGIIEVGCAR